MQKLGIYLKNKTPPRPNHFLKIQWEIHFFTFLNIDRNAIFFNSNYIALYEKTAFKTDFGPREVSELENLHFHFHAFSGWGTSRSPKSVLKAVFS